MIVLILCKFISKYVNCDMDIKHPYIYLKINAVYTEDVGVLLERGPLQRRHISLVFLSLLLGHISAASRQKSLAITEMAMNSGKHPCLDLDVEVLT